LAHWDITALVNKDSFAAIILVAGAGVPAGYILYQFYFCWRWNLPWSGDDLSLGCIEIQQGRRKGILATLEGVPLENRVDGPSCLRTYVDYLRRFVSGGETDFRMAWNCIDILLAELGCRSESNGAMAERNRYVMDMMHALGASTWAVFFTWLVVVLVKVFNDLKTLGQSSIIDWTEIGTFLLLTTVAGAISLVFRINFGNTRSQVISIQKYMLQKFFEQKPALRRGRGFIAKRQWTDGT
jgi:hypothetical protein